jgi:tripartite-type tricarboxylate transporter receptor subunit TctC
MNHHIDRRQFNQWAAAVTVGAAAATRASAQTDQPLRLVVGYAAGGPVDAGARSFAPVLARELGRNVLVENRPGAAGVLAADAVSKATPDGNLLYFAASPSLTISPHVQKSMTLDPARDLTPIAPLLTYANALVVNKDLPFQNLEQLVAYAKANPNKLFYGSAGVGASNHLSGELLGAVTGTKLTHVPYKGNAPAMTDVIGGQLSMMFDITSTARNFIQSGRVRALAVTSRERNASLPTVPTMREAGVPGYEVIGWYGLYGPARLSPDLVARLNAAVNRALADTELRKTWSDQGYDLWAGKPETLAAQASRDFELWRGVTRDMKFE